MQTTAELSLQSQCRHAGESPADFCWSPPEVADLPPERLHSPADMILANRMFRANCGPGSLAASLSLEALNVMQFFPHFPQRPFTSIAHMRAALERCRLRTVELAGLPDYGLALLQFDGSWTRPNLRASWVARYRHWIAVKGRAVYDVNFQTWIDRGQWEQSVVDVFRAVWPTVTGWRVERGIEILPQTFHAEEVVRGLYPAQYRRCPATFSASSH